jgi:hypothetical protein
VLGQSLICTQPNASQNLLEEVSIKTQRRNALYKQPQCLQQDFRRVNAVQLPIPGSRQGDARAPVIQSRDRDLFPFNLR